MKLIGNRNDFGVEYKIESAIPFMGYAKVWFGGNFLGTSKDYIYLDGYLLSGLKNISDSAEIDFLPLTDKEEMFSKLHRRLEDINDNIAHSYLKSFGTMTDDFIIFSYLYQKTIYILWKLSNNDTPFSDLNSQDIDRINYFSIKKSEYQNRLKLIEEEILNFKNITLI